MGSYEPMLLYACFAPWSGRPQVEHNAVQRARKTGLWWAKSVHLVRCGACPIHRIALRTAPARVNGFVSIKRVNNYFLWYHWRAVCRFRWIGLIKPFRALVDSKPGFTSLIASAIGSSLPDLLKPYCSASSNKHPNLG